MTPHLHTSKSAFREMGASDGQTNKIENTKRAVTTNSSSEANARFAQFGFEEKAENIAKAMQVAAVKCTVSKINRQVMPNSDGEDGDNKEDEEVEAEAEAEAEAEEEKEEKKENKEGKKDKDEKKSEDKDVKDKDESCKEDRMMLVSGMVSSTSSKEDRMMLVSSTRVVKLSVSGCVRVALMQCKQMCESAFREMGASNGQTNKIENTKRAVTTNSSPEANARFAQFGFEEKVERLANCSGFQSSMI
ncbi:hypothetical protein BDR05DRAFT_952794 [Suillus weaverae]|nr:hypothetical protein BDR05DRAFT_952794 [Suillus weaverae]